MSERHRTRQRWGIEDFCEELQNQYHLTKFPGISLPVVKRYILLPFYLYILVHRFQKLAAEWVERAERAAIRCLRWLKVGRAQTASQADWQTQMRLRAAVLLLG
jgi:hypothetical protein